MRKERGTLFVDLDGTVIDSRTNTFLPGAVEYFAEAKTDGWKIVVTTYRGANWPSGHKFSIDETLNQLTLADFRYDNIIWDSPSPRVLINDAECQAISHECNTSWEEYK